MSVSCMPSRTALIASWIVAVVFTPYLGVKLLPNYEQHAGGHADLADVMEMRGQFELFQLCGIQVEALAQRPRDAPGAVAVAEPVLLFAGTMTVVPSVSLKYSSAWLLIGRPSLLVSVIV